MSQLDGRPGLGRAESVAIEITPTSCVLRDASAVRVWFDPISGPKLRSPFIPRGAALEVLKASIGILGGEEMLLHLREGPLIEGENSFSVRFQQEFGGLRVDGGEVVVNIFSDGRVASVFNHYEYGVRLSAAEIRVTHVEAGQRVAELFRLYARKSISAATSIVYRFHPTSRPRPLRTPGKRRQHADLENMVGASFAAARRRGFRPESNAHYLAWALEVSVPKPWQHWRVLIDALTGNLLAVEDLLAYVRKTQTVGHAKIFDPNPVITSGNTSLTWTQGNLLNTLRSDTTLERLDPPDPSGHYRLDGTYVSTKDLLLGPPSGPISPDGNFAYGAKDRHFLSVMAYSHIDRFQTYVQAKLGLTKYADLKVTVDAEDGPSDDQSKWGEPGIAFGKGGDVPDASDALIILHEYGHALENHAVKGSGSGNFSGGVQEGFSDFLAAVYFDDAHVAPKKTRGYMFSWGANPEHRRSYRVAWHFDGPEPTDGYKRGQVWCASMFELYRQLGGDSTNKAVREAARALTIRLHLMANEGIPAKFATATQAAAQVLMQDTNLAGWLDATGKPRYAPGLHRKVIYDVFSARHLAAFDPPLVDVYIDDGRKGGYGSVKPNPTFDDSLWMENHGNPPGVWVQASGSSLGTPDAPAVKVGVAAQVFARVTNRGGADSGLVTVKVFVAHPGAARVWPVDWSSADLIPPSTSLGNVLKKPDLGVVVGPFSWTPTQTGTHTLLVIVECPQDQAVTEHLQAADRVPIMDLVPFDNNIAMRDIEVTA